MGFSLKYRHVAGALAVVSFSGLVSAAEDAADAGFLEGSKLDAMLRNYYWHQTGDLGHQRDWEQGVLLNFSSGFTPGIVGVGVDAFVYANATLDSGSGRTGGPNVQAHDNGEPTNGYSKAGASVKLKASETVLSLGDLEPVTPVFAVGNYYLLHQTATGVMLDSHDIDNLHLQAGHFTSGTGQLTTSRDGDLGLAYAGVDTKEVNYLGGTYSLAPELSLSLYGAQYQDLINQYYGNLNHTYAINDQQSLLTDFNIYRSLDTGKANAGDVNLTAWSLSTAYTYGAHTFGVAYQMVDGDQPFDYAAIGDTNPGVAIGKFSGGIYLANSAEISDFNGPHERSWQLRYEINMAEYGVPGLTASVKGIWGEGIDGTHVDETSAYHAFYGSNDSEQEVVVSMRYVFQESVFKDLAMTLVGAAHEGQQSTAGSNKLVRFVVDYPISFF